MRCWIHVSRSCRREAMAVSRAGDHQGLVRPGTIFLRPIADAAVTIARTVAVCSGSRSADRHSACTACLPCCYHSACCPPAATLPAALLLQSVSSGKTAPCPPPASGRCGCLATNISQPLQVLRRALADRARWPCCCAGWQRGSNAPPPEHAAAATPSAAARPLRAASAQ